MYKLWQHKYFPLHEFDEAMEQIADLGRTHQLKVTSHQRLADAKSGSSSHNVDRASQTSPPHVLQVYRSIPSYP